MNLSHNVLVIESLSIVPDNENLCFVAEMTAIIKFHCSVNGNHFRSMVLKTEANASGKTESLRKAIQNFLNGRVDSHIEYYDAEIESIVSGKIHHIDIQVPEPFKSLFEQVFNMSDWSIPTLVE